jgi:hypothetical protein
MQVNRCASVVIVDKPKRLKGLSQKACGQAGVFLFHSPQTLCHRRRGGA